MTGNAALYWVSIDIELRCLTLYLAATARLPCHKTFFSPNRVDVRHHLRRFSTVWHLSVSFEAFNWSAIASSRFWATVQSVCAPHSAVWTRTLFCVAHIEVFVTSKYQVTCRWYFKKIFLLFPTMTSARTEAAVCQSGKEQTDEDVFWGQVELISEVIYFRSAQLRIAHLSYRCD